MPIIEYDTYKQKLRAQGSQLLFIGVVFNDGHTRFSIPVVLEFDQNTGRGLIGRGPGKFC